MSRHNRSVDNARRFLWDSTSDSHHHQADAETGGANRRTNLSRGGAGFSTRDFNVVDQSVNLMDLGSSTTGTGNTSSSNASSNKKQPGKLSGLFRSKMESENLNKFTDEYGDADAMNQADAEEYIYNNKRRRVRLLPPICNQLSPKIFLTIGVAMLAFVLVLSSMGTFVEKEIEEKNNNKHNNNDNSGSSAAELDESTQRRFESFKQRILAFNISPESVFASGGGSSPQQQALDWIVLEDPAHLPYDHEVMLDRYGLAVLYYSTNADNQWKDTTNWLTKKGICSWHGIHCLPKEQEATAENNFSPTATTYDEDNFVTMITLEGNRLKGILPNELGSAFENLQTINFQNNQLIGTLLTAVSKLEHLKNLLLSSNGFSGTLPEEYTKLNNLHQLSLSNNQLEGQIPKSWETSLTKLRILAASHNRIIGSFPDLTKMVRLRELYLEENELEGHLPESLEGMTSLLDLNVGSNKFSGPIGVLKALSNLETLHLSNNEFSGTIPDMFDQLFRLHELVVPNNKFEGSIPKTVTHLQTLKILDLDSNRLEGSLPKGLGLMTDVTTISLRNNQFEGLIPTNLGRLDDIQTLSLNNNKLSGPIPTELGLCFRLKTLHLQNNMLTGTIPMELGDLVGLSSFKMEANSLEGATMPPQICALRDDDLSVLTSDCKKTSKVTCDCCTECH